MCFLIKKFNVQSRAVLKQFFCLNERQNKNGQDKQVIQSFNGRANPCQQQSWQAATSSFYCTAIATKAKAKAFLLATTTVTVTITKSSD